MKFAAGRSSLIALGVALWATAANAQSAPSTVPTPPDKTVEPSSSAGLQDIVVTARKISENLQAVPVAVTAYSGANLVQQNAVRIPDLARLTPGFTLKIASSTPVAVNLQIRGQYQSDVLATLDPSVGTYVDGLYWGRAYGLTADLLDVRSAQILRGPQGTLFGRNTTGGAILMETNNPDLDNISGKVSATYGRFNERSVTGILNFPLITDRLAIRGAITATKRDGFYHELNTGTDMANRNSWTARIKILGQVTDTLSVLLSGEHFHTDFQARPFQTAYISPSSAANLEAYFEANGPAAPAVAVPGGYALFQNYIASVAGTDNVRLNSLMPAFATTNTASATITLDTFFGALKFIGGYRGVKASTTNDLEGAPYNIVTSVGAQDLKQYSGEFQITGKAFHDFLDFTSGVFYFNESGIDQSRAIFLPRLSAVQTAALFIGDVATDSMGLYAQGTAHFTDKLSFTGGLRYSVEDKGIVLTNQTRTADASNTLVACSITGADPVTCRAQRRDSFDGVSYTAGLNFQITPDILVYAKTSKGFRSGGENLRAAGGLSNFLPFRPETAREHEIGFKTEFFDRRLRLNVAAFLSDVSDIQRNTIVTSATGTATIVGNAGKARFYGGEAELTAILFDGFTLSANGAHVKPKYVSYVDPGTGFDRSRERFEQVPEWTFSVAGTYEKELSFGKATLNANYAWQGTTAIAPFNYYVDGAGVYHDATDGSVLTATDAVATKAASTLPAGGTLNARAAISLMDDRLELAIFGRNILNRRVNENALLFGAPLSVVSVQRNDPATYGVTVSYNFGAK
ncbi:TonB-dependent receptor [Sphingomonas immobilis]|uniref:TonB-dependent receptor n=1 Tax=Sphingomonas immobilis TaxID=3063997 RepID=A0ABT9A1B8_9SPHN|nr:TonB-dependent receptor [Sphingomonas sp. CA1-15]MDO7843624.1 TonB-dependent receptor [Sphingomonas sp. CA1-15]